MSWAAVWLFSASFRTSVATTAKRPPVRPRAGRLDGGVQRQEVGLIRDLLDDRDPARDGSHGFDGLGGGALSLLGVPAAPSLAICSVLRLFSAFWEMEALICSRLAVLSFTAAACSLVPLGQHLGGGRHLGRGAAQGRSAATDLTDHLRELEHHGLERLAEAVRGGARGDARLEVPARDGIRHPGHLLERYA